MVDFSLADIVLVNESCDLRIAGDISVFRSAHDACSYFEPWWIQAGEGFMLTTAGERLLLATAGNVVVVEGKDVMPEGKLIIHHWLEASASAVLEARKHRARRGQLVLSSSEELGQLPTTTEALIEYVGFTR